MSAARNLESKVKVLHSLVNVLFFAGLLAGFSFLHNRPKWSFLIGIIFGLICIAFYEELKIFGSGTVYIAIAIVVWFYSTRTENDQ